MADKEITAQIDKLRKTRPARAIEAMAFSDGTTHNELVVVLSFLRDDLKDEARLLENAKVKGGVTIMKDRLAVAGWLELFCAQLARESSTPVREPAPERTEPVTTHDALNALVDDAKSKGLGELVAGDKRCAAQDTDHGKHTWVGPRDPQTGSSRWNCWGGDAQPELASVADYLSGASDELEYRDTALREQLQEDAATDADEYCFPCATDSHRCPGCGNVIEHDEMACGECVALIAEVKHPSGTPEHDAYSAELRTELSKFAKGEHPYPYTDAAAYIGDALEPAQQAAHTTVDQELAHVTADPIVVDPFAPIPRPVWGAAVVPPGGRAWTTADLLKPIDPLDVPDHLSFSQATTLTDCGAKWRMQRVANLPQVPQWANVGGKAFHVFVEAYERGALTSWDDVLEDEIVATEQASGMGRESFRASAGGKEGYDWWRVEGQLMAGRYVAWRTGDGAGQQVLQGPTARPMLEWETTYNVDGVPLKTVLDSAWHVGQTWKPGDSAVIRDWKTGSTTPDNRQLCTQAWGLRKAGWEGPILVQFFDARKGTFTEPFDPFDPAAGGMSWDDVRYFVLSADAQRRLPILPARPSDWCGGCPVAYACPIMNQRKAKR